VEENDRFFSMRVDQTNGGASFTNSALRTLKIAETLAREGPLSLKDLTANLPFHRSSIWRALDVLRQQGWIRTQLGGNMYEISNKFRDMIVRNNRVTHNTEEIYPVLSFILDRGLYHIDYGCFEKPGQFVLLESSRSTFAQKEVSLTDDSLAIAAQLHMSAKKLQEHLDAFASTASKEERLILQSDEHIDLLNRCRSQNQIWDDERTEVSICLSKIAKRDCAIRISLKTPTIKNKKALVALVGVLISAFNLDA